ncbi:MAG: hypothetical protein M1816_006703 [Peltula sp. TS41687]|nr:MAG: hypothetical protein M1816_006703 [Peltula sp. TS41687]
MGRLIPRGDCRIRNNHFNLRVRNFGLDSGSLQARQLGRFSSVKRENLDFDSEYRGLTQSQIKARVAQLLNRTLPNATTREEWQASEGPGLRSAAVRPGDNNSSYLD